MDLHIQEQTAKLLSISEYAAELARNGGQISLGTTGTFWVRHESVTMLRMPTFHREPPSPGEIRRILWRGRAGMVSYILDPDECHPAGAWLYVCTDKAYALNKLPPAMQRNVRRGLRELRITSITPEQLVNHGLQAYSDTVRRNGLSYVTPEAFRQFYSWRGKCRGHAFLGAWKNDKLAAFLSITEVDDWAEIEGCFSMDSMLQLRPNDTLLFYALRHYLTERSCRLVDYGLSSIQTASNRAGLHAFKTKVGFEALPVHRAFVVHPILYLFVNRLSLWGVHAALSLRPGDRRLQKAGGVLASLLGHKEMLIGPPRKDSVAGTVARK